jgi:hypothetical protein
MLTPIHQDQSNCSLSTLVVGSLFALAMVSVVSIVTLALVLMKLSCS